MSCVDSLRAFRFVKLLRCHEVDRDAALLVWNKMNQSSIAGAIIFLFWKQLCWHFVDMKTQIPYLFVFVSTLLLAFQRSEASQFSAHLFGHRVGLEEDVSSAEPTVQDLNGLYMG